MSHVSNIQSPMPNLESPSLDTAQKTALKDLEQIMTMTYALNDKIRGSVSDQEVVDAIHDAGPKFSDLASQASTLLDSPPFEHAPAGVKVYLKMLTEQADMLGTGQYPTERSFIYVTEGILGKIWTAAVQADNGVVNDEPGDPEVPTSMFLNYNESAALSSLMSQIYDLQTNMEFHSDKDILSAIASKVPKMQAAIDQLLDLMHKDGRYGETFEKLPWKVQNMLSQLHGAEIFLKDGREGDSDRGYIGKIAHALGMLGAASSIISGAMAWQK